MASYFLSNHSSAATARLAGLDRASAAPLVPSDSESKLNDVASSANDVDLTDPSTDDSNADPNDDDVLSLDGSSNGSAASDATTPSRASPGRGDDASTTTTTTTTTREEYDDGDLQTLNRLVNKLHAAELRRERRRKHDGDVVDDDDDVDLPSVLPPPGSPPRFSPLHAPHNLSVSSVESWRGPSFEVMPTEGVDGIMTLWRNEWTRDRAEWEERRKGLLATDMELRRSRTHDGRRRTSSPPPRGDPGGGPDLGLVRRNNSLPTNACQASRGSASSSAVGGTNRNYKYGRPPSLPRSDEPNPMVRRSSKMINKKHARYALCAGMMLGIRESVGGALGVEAELEISNWEGCERSWGEGCREGEDDDDEGGEVVLLDGLKSDVGGGGGGVGDDVSRPSSSPSSSPSRRRRYNDPPSSRDNAAVAAALTAECERVAKYKFPPHQFYLGSNTSSPLPHKYKFKVYAPLVFARIRSLFGVEKQTFLHSICGKFNFYEFASNARSGQFFFYSHDGRYMIKTLTFAESKFLREILPFYYRHLTRFPSTFLTHFYGMFRVCMPDANNQLLHFVIMRSVFHTKKKISRVWDLKGSTANRKSEPGDSVGKDLDMLEEGRKLRFADPGARGAFLEQLRRDATFLARLGIMDYSLLLGLHNCEEEREGDVGGGGGGVGDDATVESASSSILAVGDEPSRSNTPFRRGVLHRAKTAGYSHALELHDESEEPSRSNTPLRRGMLHRATTAGYTKRGYDVFEALESRGSASGDVADDDIRRAAKSPLSLNAIPELSRSSSDATARVPKSAITSRSDSGIEGYRVAIRDGTLAKTKEIYFCGIIDFLQYYNAKKMGETVIKKMSSSEDISCVDPETYGNRFFKFISSLIEKE